MATAPKPSKYRAKRCELDGKKFPSQKERDRYAVLKLREKAGEIRNLTLQRRFPLYGAMGIQIAVWISDFDYVEEPSGEWVIEDVKSGPTHTAIYRLKKRWFEADYRMQIREV
jgi:hypothetical protein